MRKILSLLKLQIDNKTDILKATSPRTMIPAVLRVLAFLVLATFAVGMALSRVFVLGFAINAELLSLVLLLTQLISLAFAIGNVVNTLYLCRDNEMLVCLPVTPNQLFISKLLLIYISELAVNAAISVPLFVTLGRIGMLGSSFYFSIPILLLLLPIFPIVVAAFISVPLMWIIRFLKKHTVLSILVVFSFVAVCLWGYFILIGSIAGEFNIASEQYETVRTVNALIADLGKRIPLYYQLGTAMMKFSSYYFFALFMLLCAAVSALTVLFTRYFFFKIAMSSLENTIRSKPRYRRFRRTSVFFSLFMKEVRCVFRSTSDVFEYFLFTLLMPFIVFSYDRLLMSVTVNQAGTNMIAGAHVMVLAILAMLSNLSSASAVSRDGNNFHTSKTIPVGYYTQMMAKFFFNAVFTIVAIVATSIVSAFTYPLWQVILGGVAVAMTSIGHIAFCIDSDIKSPTINLQGNEKASTVSKSTPMCLIYGLVIGFILGMIVIMMSSLKNVMLPYYCILAISFVFMLYRVYTMILRIHLAYDKIEM